MAQHNNSIRCSRLRYAYVTLVVIVGIAGFATIAYRTHAPQTDTKAEFGGVSLNIDYATTTSARERGLGGRESISGDYGMLFVFARDGLYGFWMKDMLAPIDIFWLDTQGQVVSIAAGVAPSTYPHVFYPAGPARYVLETAAGFATANHVATGTMLSLKNIPIVSE